MASTNLIVNYRPLKIGFCVRENNLSDVIRAIELNSILWGGIYNPIIPVGINTDIASTLMKFFQVDLLYLITETAEINEFINKYPHLEWPNRYEGKLFYQEDQGVSLAALDISHIIDHYWEKEFKLNKKSNCVLPQWKDDDPLSAVFTLEFGKFPTTPSFLFKYEEGYKKGLRAKVVKINKTATLEPEFAKKVFPLQLTDDRLKIWGGKMVSSGIYVGDPTDASDLLNFWNLRASTVNLRFLPLNASRRLKPILLKHIEAIKKFDQTRRIPRGVGVWYKETLNENVVKRATKAYFNEQEPRTHYRVNDYTWKGDHLENVRTFFESKTILASVDFPFNTPSIAIQLPEKPTGIKNRYTSRQLLGFSFYPLSEYEYKGYTLKLPFLPELNDWYCRNALLGVDNFRISRDNSTVIQELRDETLSVRPIKSIDIIKKIFSHAGIDAKESQPGLIAQRLIEQMGDIEDCRVFKITGVRKLISSHSPTDAVTYSEAIQTIRDCDPVSAIPSFDKFKGLYIQQRNTPELTPQDTWDYLLEKNVFRAGVEPVCPNCNLPFWLSLRDLNERVTCEYCGTNFNIAPQLRHRGDFRFRKSGLFRRDNNQEGAIPVALTLLQMSRLDRIDKSLFATALKLTSQPLGIDCETDLVALDSNNGIKPSIAIGECKTHDEITQQDIDNLLKVKTALDSKGLETYLLFSKTTSFTPDEISRFKALVAQNVYPILFTDVELEPYDPYRHHLDNKVNLPQPYTHTFEGIATNSHYIYLRQLESLE